VENATVECQGAEHDAIHEHPAYEGRGCPFVEPEEAFFSDGDEEALERTGKSCGRAGLQADFDGIERVADYNIYELSSRTGKARKRLNIENVS
jgi:hypothetical protein